MLCYHVDFFQTKKIELIYYIEQRKNVIGFLISIKKLIIIREVLLNLELENG